ncbi:universal stress protein [Leifsonia sp. F6_8S_P_1B]|uniref:Universal stress protein n=1 Tax=Leifsonia williamsii TaxID=3035919 RepID=A0ABT8K7M2_9MICO|nr:universal stress protein [Leifsonia williamsii]MDN4613463.1 universal stress protein [Leifsonia williamsii]
MAGRIVVGIDGSSQSSAALEWAIARAHAGGSALDIVTAYTLPAMEFYGFVADPHAVDWAREYSMQILAAAADRAREVDSGLAVTESAEIGPASGVLIDAAEGADMLVVGRRGLGSAMSALLGSVSDRLSVQAPCPLIVVGPEEAPSAQGPVVVGVDGSEFGEAALAFAAAEARIRGVGVRVVSVTESRPAVSASDPELAARMSSAAEVDADAVIAGALESVPELSGSDGVETAVADGHPAEAIVANAQDAQLIVVGSHGKGFLRRALLGSVSREVLRNAERPVAVVGRRAERS